MINIRLDKKKKYLLACSFGPDSMALFSLLVKGKYDFSVAHVNYGLREEADDETKKLSEFCKEKNVELFVKKIDQKIEKNVEEKCREIRYQFFKELYLEYNFDAVLVAHNEDDFLETYLLQKKRKNIVENYGIKEISSMDGVCILRPLLDISKKTLKNYDDKNKVPYSIDKTNLEDKFERNKIRHNIIEKMSDEERLKLKTKIIKENIAMLEKRNAILRAHPNKIEEILKFDDEDLAYYLTTLARYYDKTSEISLRRVAEFRKALSSKKPNIIIKIKNDIYLVKSYENVSIKPLPKDASFCFTISNASEFDCDYFYLNFINNSSNRNVSKKDYPITIRNASKNDFMIINNHSISLRRQFINWKMPKELRIRWPVICDKNNQIIYVPKYSATFVPEKDCNFFVKI